MVEDAYVAIVAGAPGTGKSSVGRLLAWELNCGFLESSVFLERSGAASPDPSLRATLVIDEDRATSAIRLLASRLSRCLVVASPTPGLWLDAIPEHIAFAALLRCDPRVLYSRLSARGWPVDKVVENVLAEAFDEYAEALSGFDAVFEVDTSRYSPERSVGELLGLLEEWRPGVSINWLSNEMVSSFVSKLLAELDPYEYRLRQAWSLDDGGPSG